MFVDLHIHSSCSDGTISPEDIIETAYRNGVGIISIADHNTLDAYKQIKEVGQTSIKIIVGVELDCVYADQVWHVLGYNFDLLDPAFNRFVESIKMKQEAMSELLISKMATKYPHVSSDEYVSYTYQRSRGGWKGINYILDKGLSTNLLDGMRYYNEFNVRPIDSGFPTLGKVCEAIHQAGGITILAHPGELISQKETLEELFLAMKTLGIDGIECFYPTHTKKFTSDCLTICHKLNMYITAGSDCHGGFAYDHSIGLIQKSLKEIRLPKSVTYLKSVSVNNNRILDNRGI